MSPGFPSQPLWVLSAVVLPGSPLTRTQNQGGLGLCFLCAYGSSGSPLCLEVVRA